jgi:hypothetical protein
MRWFRRQMLMMACRQIKVGTKAKVDPMSYWNKSSKNGMGSAVDAYYGLVANKGCAMWLVTAFLFDTQLSFPVCSASYFYAPPFPTHTCLLCVKNAEQNAERCASESVVGTGNESGRRCKSFFVRLQAHGFGFN